MALYLYVCTCILLNCVISDEGVTVQSGGGGEGGRGGKEGEQGDAEEEEEAHSERAPVSQGATAVLELRKLGRVVALKT